MFFAKKQKQKGFTLVELLVTISIFVILTGIVLWNQTKFNSTILLTNLAYDTALTIRQAQSYGINIKEFNTDQFVPYGVHFEENSKSFILFADTGYDPDNPSAVNNYEGETDECLSIHGCVSRYSIKRGNYVSNIEAFDGSTSISKEQLEIVFKRPNPDAIIYAKDLGDSNYTLFDKAIITLKGVDDSIRTVSVQSNGLIEVSK
jgi:prepilin-type N-terminal cleavage/methylation domain-containing protein